MATKATKKPQSLVDKNKDFMSNFSYDRMNPPAPQTNPLATRPAVPTSQPNTDVVDTFNGLRQQATPQGYRRPVTRRGMSGQELSADGSDPGSGMKWFDANNSPAQVDARNARQGQIDFRRANQMQAAGASAVAERKALQEMGQAPFQLAEANRAANSVKSNSRGPNGESYMTMFDGRGNAVGTNLPLAQKTVFDPGTSSTNPMDAGLQGRIQQGFNQDAQRPRVNNSPPASPAPDFLDSYATPGGNAAPVVGAPSIPGTPGGGAPKATQLPPNAGPAPALNYEFDSQIADQLKRNMPAARPPVAYSDPFVGAPYGGKLNARQEEILGLFAPKTSGSGMFGAPKPTGQVRSGNTGPMSSIIPGTPGQLGWPMMQNEDVQSFAQFFPGMNWSADYGDASRSRVQSNFDQLIKQNAIRVGPDGNYQIVPQNPMEKMLSQY